MPIYVICDYYIQKTDLADLSSLNNFLGDFHGKFQNIFYLWNQGIYNLSKPNSLCFGNISKFPVFSLTGNFFWSFSLFSLCSGYPVYSNRFPFFNITSSKAFLSGTSRARSTRSSSSCWSSPSMSSLRRPRRMKGR